MDKRLAFDENLKTMSNKMSKSVGFLRKLQNVLPRSALLAIYRCSIRPHLGHGDIVLDQTYNLPSRQKLESIQRNTNLASIGKIRGSSREKLYQGLGLESLQRRRWYRKLCCFYKKNLQ